MKLFVTCDCSTHTPVTSAKCGQTVQCVCGEQITVPILSELREQSELFAEHEENLPEDASPSNPSRQFALRYSMRLFALICVLVSMLVCYAGLQKQSGQKSSARKPNSSFGVVEVELALEQIEVGVTTRKDIETLIGSYIESRWLYRVKETGVDRRYFFVPRNRQVWFTFSRGNDGVETVSEMGELEPKAKWIQNHEGGYLTFSPSESPW